MAGIKRILAIALLSFCSVSIAQQSQRESATCLDTKKFFDYLKSEYKEVPAMVANYNGKLLSIWINIKTKTATIVLSDPIKGESCLVADLIDAKLIDISTKT